ncbi:MAG: hypothetical protein F6K31_11715 [Symploca sp. SIO2G7]|nr:hypothetical protein [Symploca sp. SIO2G7]
MAVFRNSHIVFDRHPQFLAASNLFNTGGYTVVILLVFWGLTFVVCHLSFVVCPLSFVLCHLSFVPCHW